MADSTGEDAWMEHDREQRRAWLRLTPRQRLDWLWSARSFALRAANPDPNPDRRWAGPLRGLDPGRRTLYPSTRIKR